MFATLLLAAPAFAQSTPSKAPGAAPDMTQMGPWTRKPTNEKQTKKEITEFMTACEQTMKSGDFAGALAHVDFPVFMITDDKSGMPEAQAMTKEQYSAIMKPFFENMPKDMKVTHKPTITVLSDSLANVTDDFTMAMGKNKMSGRSASLLIKRNGEWKWKSMTEAGWGGMTPAAGSGTHHGAP
jgi:hypothetical protein